MAVRKCPKCDGVVSRLVRVCPHCGARIASGTGTEIGLLVGLVVLAAAVVLAIKGAGSTAPKQPPAATRTVPSVEQPTPPPPPAPAPPAPAPVVATPPPAPQPVEKPALARGMTMDAVRQLWGAPEKTSSAQSATTRSDWWTYDDGQKLHFVDSVLESWAQSEAPATATSPPGEPAAGPVADEKTIRTYGALEAALKHAQQEDRAVGSPKALKGRLVTRYTAEVRARFGITEDQQQQILIAGDANHWALPLIVFGPDAPGTVPAASRPTVGASYLTGILFDMLPGQSAPEDAGQKTELPPDVTLRVLGFMDRGSTTWFHVQVVNPGGPNAAMGWISGLTVMTTPVTHNGLIEPAGSR